MLSRHCRIVGAEIDGYLSGVRLSLHIRELRQARGLTIEQLAEKVGVSRPHMSEVERGKKNLNNHLLERIADALDVQPADLITDPGDPVSSVAAIIRQLPDDDRARVEAFAAALLRSQQD